MVNTPPQAQPGDELMRQMQGSLQEQLSLAEDFQRRGQERFGEVASFAAGQGVQNVESIRDLGQRVPGEAPSALIQASTGLGRALQTGVAEAQESASNKNVISILTSMLDLETKKKASNRADRQLVMEEAVFASEMASSGLMFNDSGEIVVDPEALSKQTKAQIESVDDLRGELMGQQGIKDFLTVKTSFEKVKNAEDTAGGDLALIFNYMKTLDPGSTVREGEFATAQNSAGVPDRIKNAYNKAIEGTRLNPTQRADFKRQAGIQFNTHIKSASERAKFYRELADERGLNSDDVVGVLGELEPILVDSIISEKDETKRGQRKGFFRALLDSIFGTKEVQEIKVTEKSSGKSGTIPASEFNPELYERTQ